MKSLVGLAGALSLAGFSWIGMGMHDQISTKLETQANTLLATNNIEGVEVEFDHLDGIVRGAETEEQRRDVRDILAAMPPISRIEFAEDTAATEVAETLSIDAAEDEANSVVNAGDSVQLFSDALEETAASFVPGETEGTDLAFVDGESESNKADDSNTFTGYQTPDFPSEYASIAADHRDQTELQDDAEMESTEEPAVEHAEEPTVSDVVEHTNDISQDTGDVASVDPQTETAEHASESTNVLEDHTATHEATAESITTEPQDTADSENVAENSGSESNQTVSEELASTTEPATSEAEASEDTIVEDAIAEVATDDVTAAPIENTANEISTVEELPATEEAVADDTAFENELPAPEADNSNEQTPPAADASLPNTNESAPTTAAPEVAATKPADPLVEPVSESVAPNDPTTELTETPNPVQIVPPSTTTTTDTESSVDTPTTAEKTQGRLITNDSAKPNNLTRNDKSAKIDLPRLGLYMTGFENDNIVRKIDDDSAIDQGGLKVGDRVVRIGIHDVTNFADVKKSMKGRNVGDMVRIWFERQNTLYLVDIRLLGGSKSDANAIGNANTQTIAD